MNFDIKEFLNLNNKKKLDEQRATPQPASTAIPRRNVASRVFDQVNPFDNNRTWQQTTPTNTKSLWQQGIQSGAQLARGTAPGIIKSVNTAKAGLGGFYGLGKIGAASVLGTDQGYQNTLSGVDATMKRDLSPNAGALGLGTVFKNYNEALNATPLDIAKKSARYGVQNYLEGKTLSYGAPVGGAIAKEGIVQGLKSQTPNLIKNFGLNTAQGAVTAYNQGGSTGDILKSAGLNAVAGTVGDVGIGIGGAALGNIAKAPKTALSNVTTKLIGNTPLNEGGYLQMPSGKQINDLLYHGSPKADKIMKDGFKVNPSQSRTNGSNYGSGVYLTNQADRAQSYGGVIDTSIPKDAKIYRPKDVTSEIFGADTNYGDPALVTKKFKALGYDGLEISKSTKKGAPKEVVIFDPSIIKTKDSPLNYINNKIPLSKQQVPIVGQNLSRSSTNNIPKDPKLKQSKFAQGITRSKEVSSELQKSVKESAPGYIPLKNIDQVQVSKDLLKKGYQKAATQVTEKLNGELGKISAQDAVNTIQVIKTLDFKGGTANIQKATELSNKLSEHFTKAGQTVQAASILSNRSPEGLLYGARTFLTKNGIDITSEMQNNIKAQIEVIKKATGEDKLYKIGELQQQISGYVPSSISDKATGLWKAGLLTGIKTQTGNTLSGISTNVMKTTSDAIAAPLDIGAKYLGKTDFGKKLGFTGERSKTFTFKGKGSGLIEGANKGLKSLKTGIDERGLETSKFDTKKLVFSKKPLGKIAQRYTDSVYGLMGAADRPNYYSNLRNNLYDLAITDAKNKGLKGSERNVFIKDFVSNPPVKHLQTATNSAERAIFANDTQLSKWAASLRKGSENNPFAKVAINVVLPFTKVPSSVAMRMIDYSPVGSVKTLVKSIGEVKKTGILDQRALVSGLSEAGVGTGALYIGFKLKEAGLMTGSYPTDEKERELWKLEGKQPNSIKVGNKWNSVNYTSPAGQVLTTGGKLYDANKEGQKGIDLVSTGIASGLKTVTEQSFLQGAQGALDVVSDPAKEAPKYIKNTSGSVIPTIVNDINKATDPLQRQSNNPKEAIQSRLPILGKRLLPKQDAFGKPLDRQSSPLNTLVNPFRPSDVKLANNLNTELRRLQDASYGVMPSTTDKTLTYGSKDKGTEVKINLTPQQLYDKNSAVGQKTSDMWNKIISSSAYQDMSDSEKQKALRNALSDINALNKAEFASANKPELLDTIKLTKEQIKLGMGDDTSSSYVKTTAKKEKQTYDNTVASSQSSLELSRAITSNDLNKYTTAARKEIGRLEALNKTFDPTTEQDKINSTTSKIESLTNKIDNYETRGYIKKGKSGKSKKNKGRLDYSKGLASSVSNTNALRNIIKASKIRRKRIKA